jgi:hypothetical protein
VQTLKRINVRQTRVRNMTKENKIKAEAIMGFVNQIAGAHKAGFTYRNNCTISELYRIAQNHCLDELQIQVPNIIDRWGEDTAKSLGLGDPEFN